MKILVFEFVCGGGLAGEPLPASLAAEGGMMLQALLDDLKDLPDIQLLLPLDKRCISLSVPDNAELLWVGETDNILDRLPDLISQCDAVWPVAPESDGLLLEIAEMVEATGKDLLLSTPASVAICSNKLDTCRLLTASQLPVVETLPVVDLPVLPFVQTVIKPVDGAGCEGSLIVSIPELYRDEIGRLDKPENYVAQPLLQGRSISLSCLFNYGEGRLLCCNLQQIQIFENRFKLSGCLVNVDNPRRVFYQNLVQQIATAIPGLWGYIGIDLIETAEQGALILEINPRLTTSYVGIKSATGINVAEQVLRMLRSKADFRQSRNRIVQVNIF